MDITYNDKVTIDGSSYIYSEGGEIVLNFGSVTFVDPFNLEFDLQTNTTSSWNAPLEIEGISGFNIQNAGYTSYFTCIWGNTSHVMDTYPITSEEYVHYHIWQQNGSIFIQITQSNGVSYSYNATYNGSFSTIHLGNYHKENRATGVVKNVKFTTVNNYLDTIGLTSLWSKIKSLFATKTELGSKANDSEVVHKSGDETIKGNKYFNGNFVDVNGYRFRVKGPNQEVGVIPTGGNKWNGFSFYDKNNKQTFAIENGHLVNGTTLLNFSLTRNLVDSTLFNYESVIFFKDGENCEKSLKCDVYPSVNNKYILGTSSLKWKNVYATTFNGNLVGNADTATKATTADTATKATQDSDGNQINTTYSKNGHTHDDRYYTESEVNNLLNGKANNADVVHKRGDETVNGVKTFASNIVIQGGKKVVCNVDNSFLELNGGTTWGKGGSIVLSGQNRPSNTNSVLIVSKNDTDTFIIEYQNGTLTPMQGDNYLGTSTNKWKTLNGINPGALSLPSNNSIDILSTLQSDGYTAPSNGYVRAIKNVKTECSSTFGIRNETTGIEDRRIAERVFVIGVIVPVKTGEKVIISNDWNSVSNANITYSASFYPCSGNV